MNEKIEHIELEVLTPIFIGGCETKDLKKLDYIYEDNKINIISQEKLINYLQEKKLYDKFYNALKIGNKNFRILNFFKENKLIDYKNRIYKESINITGYNRNQINEINRFVSDGYGKKYIPGSSLKGMIVNAIKCKYMNDHNYEMQGLRQLEQLNRKEFDKELGAKSRQVDKILVRKIENKEKIYDDKLAQYIQVSDSQIIDDNATFFDVKEDLVLKYGQVKVNSISLCREYIKPGTKIQFSIKVQYNKLKELGIYCFEDIVKALEFKTNDVMRLQSKIIEVAEKSNIRVYYSNNSDIPNAILGGGAGYFSKSVLYNSSSDKKMIYRLVAKQLDNKFRHNHIKFDTVVSPRTVKLSSYNNKKYVVGMCKIKKL